MSTFEPKKRTVDEILKDSEMDSSGMTEDTPIPSARENDSKRPKLESDENTTRIEKKSPVEPIKMSVSPSKPAVETITNAPNDIDSSNIETNGVDVHYPSSPRRSPEVQPSTSTSVDTSENPVVEPITTIEKSPVGFAAPLPPQTQPLQEQINSQSPSSTAPTSTSHIEIPPTDDPELLKEQLKFCANIIRQLKKDKHSAVFRKPVDPVALNIPSYFSIIKHPMDLSTVEKKLQQSKYPTVASFIDDVRLIFRNCELFNGYDSVFGKLARTVEEIFDSLLKKMPNQVKKRPSLPVVPRAVPLNSKDSQVTLDSKSSESVMDGTGENGRPKREIHAPSRDIPSTSTTKKSHKKLSPRMKYAAGILKEISSKKYQSINFLFLHPVDPVALNIPEYFDIIKRPMDLGTVKTKLDADEYANPEQMKSDIKTIFTNCYTFNPVGSDAYLMAQELERVFDQKWRDMPELPDAVASPTTSVINKTQSRYEESSSDSDEDDIDKKQLELLKQNLEFIQQQIAALSEKSRRKKEKRKSISGAASSSKSKVTKESKGSKSRRKSSDTPRRQSKIDKPKKRPRPDFSDSDDGKSRVITFEQKRELSESINLLPGEKLAKVVEIIHASMPHLQDTAGQDEIELDIDSLDPKTLYKLYHYVKVNTSKSSSKKAKSPKKRQRSSAKAKGAVKDSGKAGRSSSSGSDSDDSGNSST